MKTLIKYLSIFTLIIATLITVSHFTTDTPVTAKAPTHYTYEITHTNGDDINGKAIDNLTSDNQGIYLQSTDIPFTVTPGDKITITYDQHNDIQTIEQSIQAEDGSFVPASYYE